MTWAERTSRALVDTFGGSFDADGVVVASAALDADDACITTDPVGPAVDQRFEIGSVTKTMTATMLALLAERRTLSLDDEIGRWLSAGPHSAITIRQLATHTSGLPAMAPNRRAGHADSVGSADPWAGYTFELAEAGLRESVVAPGNPWRYSNLGYQLLGLILERASGQDYAALLSENLFEKLSMSATGVGPSHGSGTLLPGHAAGREVPAWSHPLGAGGVESTITDMARYARACLLSGNAGTDPLLAIAIRLAQTPVVSVSEGVEQALAWAVYDGTIREHSGGTGGFSSSVSVDHARGRAVVLLVSYGGSPALSTHFKRAARMALAGQDPRQAAAPQPWPSWREDARDIARALLRREFAQVHARLAPAMRQRVKVENLERAWFSRTRDAGAPGRISIAQHEIAATGAVVADISIDFAGASLNLRLVVLPTGELGGLSFLPPAA